MFLTRRNTIDGKIQSIVYVQCRHPGCAICFENTISGKTRLPDDALVHIASRKGWRMNHKKRMAFCPKHVRH